MKQALSSRLLDLCRTDTAGVFYTDYHTQRQGVGVLVSSGADPDVCDDTGLSALTIAAIRGRVAVVQSLLHHGASLHGGRALVVPSQKSKKGVISWARKHGGPLLLAAGLGCVPVCR